MRIKKKDMLNRIPSYPSACSLINLAAHLGYINKEMSADEISSVLEVMEKKLFWSLVSDNTLVGSEMKTQRSTRIALTSFGFEDIEMFPTSIYLPRDRG